MSAGTYAEAPLPAIPTAHAPKRPRMCTSECDGLCVCVSTCACAFVPVCTRECAIVHAGMFVHAISFTHTHSQLVRTCLPAYECGAASFSLQGAARAERRSRTIDISDRTHCARAFSFRHHRTPRRRSRRRTMAWQTMGRPRARGRQTMGRPRARGRQLRRHAREQQIEIEGGGCASIRGNLLIGFDLPSVKMLSVI